MLLEVVILQLFACLTIHNRPCNFFLCLLGFGARVFGTWKAVFAHSWVSVLWACLALVLSAGWVMSSSGSFSSWEIMCGLWLAVVGDAKTLSMVFGLILVSSHRSGSTMFLCCWFITCFMFVMSYLAGVFALLMVWLGFSVSFSFRVFATF